MILVKIFEHACEMNDFEQFRKVNEELISSFKSSYFMSSASQNLAESDNLLA